MEEKPMLLDRAKARPLFTKAWNLFVPPATTSVNEGAFKIPLRWRKPYHIRVSSDLFHEDVPDLFIADVFATATAAYWLTFQFLTKRPERMAQLLNDPAFRALVAEKAAQIINGMRGMDAGFSRSLRATDNLAQWVAGAAPNQWLGTSVENQEMADRRIPELLRCPAAVRFLSCEPLLGPVDLSNVRFPDARMDVLYGAGVATRGIVGQSIPNAFCKRIDWVIIGGESGPNARPTNIAWISDLREQCQAAGVATFVKQMGSKPWAPVPEGVGLAASELPIRLRHPHGGNPEEWAEADRVREFPR